MQPIVVSKGRSMSDAASSRSLLAALFRDKPTLDLGPLDLCFLVSLRLRAEQQGLAGFSEQSLFDTFADVCELCPDKIENVAARATHTLRRLREQGLLMRVDGAGVVRAGDFALSRLGHAIVESFSEHEALTISNLEVLAQSLLASVNEALSRARQAGKPEDWQANVVGPLRIAVSELILGIERRQRALDLEQEQFQKQISNLLATDWFDAIEACEQLLASTAATLRQLNELLLSHTHRLQAVLQDILELASAAEARVAEAVTYGVMGQLDRVAAWGIARQAAWSEYYEQVNRYLREVVRLDPARALTERLREQLGRHEATPFALMVADEPSIRVLKTALPPTPPAPVRRPRGERAPRPELSAAADTVDAIDTRVRAALAQGSLALSELTARVTEELPPERHFASAGKVAELAARLADPQETRERPWVPVRDGLVIEEWRVESPGASSS